MCKVLILLFIIITFIKNPENAPNLLALDHHLPLIKVQAICTTLSIGQSNTALSVGSHSHTFVTSTFYAIVTSFFICKLDSNIFSFFY